MTWVKLEEVTNQLMSQKNTLKWENVILANCKFGDLADNDNDSQKGGEKKEKAFGLFFM